MILNLIETDFEGTLHEGVMYNDAVCTAAKRALGWSDVARTWNRLYNPSDDESDIYDISGYTINGDDYTGSFYLQAQEYIKSQLIKKSKFKSTTVNLELLSKSVRYFYTDTFFSEKAPKVTSDGKKNKKLSFDEPRATRDVE